MPAAEARGACRRNEETAQERGVLELLHGHPDKLRGQKGVWRRHWANERAAAFDRRS